MQQMADDLLNGSDAEPRYGGPIDTSMTTRPSQGDVQSGGSAVAGNPRAVLIAWVVVLAILVAAHVVTLKIQR